MARTIPTHEELAALVKNIPSTHTLAHCAAAEFVVVITARGEEEKDPSLLRKGDLAILPTKTGFQTFKII